MTDVLSFGVGAAFSLLFGFVPGVREWYDKLDGNRKRLVMFAILILSASVFVALSCFGWYFESSYCSQDGLKDVVKSVVEILLSAAVGNQTTWSVIKGYVEKRKSN